MLDTRVPVVALSCWSVMLVDDCDIYITGWDIWEGRGRVSGLIREFNTVDKIAKSVGGVTYELLYSPAFNSDAFHEWSSWVAKNKVTKYEDVTASYAKSEKA